MVKKTISVIVIAEITILLSNLFSFEIFINIQVAVLSSFFIILGSSYAYKNIILKKLHSRDIEKERDALDKIEDPYELYDDEINETQNLSSQDIKTIIKDERSKIKTFSLSNIKYGIFGGVSVYRFAGYLFLVLGFVALKNNELLDLRLYLSFLAVGIFLGAYVAKTNVKA